MRVMLFMIAFILDSHFQTGQLPGSASFNPDDLKLAGILFIYCLGMDIVKEA